MSIPNELLYTKDHEWAQANGDIVTVGITDHAQEALGEVVYVELPKVGRELKAHETFGVVESIKAVSDLYSPIAGKVVEVNTDAAGDPGIVNKSPYTNGWLIKVQLSDKNALSELMKPEAYQSLIASLK